MFNFDKKDKRTEIEKEIDCLAAELKALDPETTEYTIRLELIERLTKVKAEKKLTVSFDTILLVACNLLLGVGTLYREELGHVISTRATQFMLQRKV